ncbi:MAG: hypothetical protein MZW92_80375 [Comamonadaceae bacterium]|nr:hypothetical protein [Comamonadaceae bacterium]
MTIESLLLTVTRIGTFDGQRPMTNATGFFFERDERLFLVTSRHVHGRRAEQALPGPHRDRDCTSIRTTWPQLDRLLDSAVPRRQERLAPGAGRGRRDRRRRDRDRTRGAAADDRAARLHAAPPACGSAHRSRSAPRCWWSVFRSASTTRCTTCRWCATR